MIGWGLDIDRYKSSFLIIGINHKLCFLNIFNEVVDDEYIISKFMLNMNEKIRKLLSREIYYNETANDW